MGQKAAATHLPWVWLGKIIASARKMHEDSVDEDNILARDICMSGDQWHGSISSGVLAELMCDGVLVLDDKKRILHCNEEYASMMGSSIETLRGKSVYSLVQASDKDSLLDALNEVEPGKPSKLRITWAPTGADPFQSKLSLASVDNNEVVRFILVASDREELVEASRTFQTLCENLSDGLYLTDFEGKITFLNHRGAELFGYSKSELNQLNFINLVHPDDRESILKLVEKSFQTGTTTSGGFEARGIRKDGSVFHFHVTNTLLKKNNQPVGFQSLIRDVTNRKLGEKALQESEWRYRDLFTHAPVSIWEEDFTEVGKWMERLRAEGIADIQEYLDQNPEAVNDALSLVRVIDVNDYTVEMWEADSKGDLLVPLTNLFHEKTYQAFRRELVAIWDGKPDTLSFESMALSLKGKPINTSVVWKASIISGKMDLSRVIVSIADITEQKRAENRYKTVVQSIDDLIIVFDSENKYSEYYSPDISRLYVQPEEFLRKRIEEVLPEEVAKLHVQTFEAVRESGESKTIDYPLQIQRRRHWFSGRFSLHEDRQSIVGVIRDITSRKNAEDSLRDSEERFSTFTDFIPGPVFIKDEDSRMLYSNKFMIERFGFQEYIGRSTEELYPAWIAERLIDDDRRALSEGSIEVVQSVPDMNGNEHIYRVYKFPIRRPGKSTLLGGIALDITDHVRGEEELKASERRYRTLVEESLQGVAILQDERYVYVNPAFCATVGHDKDVLLSFSSDQVWTLIHPEDIPELENRNSLIAAGVEIEPRHRFRYIRPDSEERVVESFVSPIEHEGRPAILVLDVDITDAAQAEEAIRASELKYRSLVEQFTQGVVIAVGPPLRIVFANRAFASQAGISPEELVDLSSDDVEALLHPDDYQKVLQRFAELMNGRPPDDIPFGFRFIRPDDEIKWLEALGRPIQYQGQKALQITLSDITERVKSDMEKDKAREELKAAAETAMLYLDILGHDIRNQLQAIMWGMELALMRQPKPDVSEAIRHV
ncbi:MAG: PAS domain S-box protein, partial [Candidatus Hodarchaeota archaeon]